MKYKAKKGIRKLFIVAIVMLLAFTSSVSAFAATGVYFGRGNVYWGIIDYDVASYLYYNTNSSTKLDVDSLVMYVYNYGVDVNEVHFEVFDSNYAKYTVSWGYLANPITNGNSARLEADWDSICYANHQSFNTEYSKTNGNGNFVYADMVAGQSYAGLGGWESFWFPTYYDPYFHY